MGKKKAGGGGGLGRALIKERLQAGRGPKRGDSWVCWLIQTHLNDQKNDFSHLFVIQKFTVSFL